MNDAIKEKIKIPNQFNAPDAPLCIVSTDELLTIAIAGRMIIRFIWLMLDSEINIPKNQRINIRGRFILL
jgi:hypothetical protein